MVQFAHTDNVTWDYLPVGYWSAVETHVGVVVACLPAIRSLQRSIRERLWPKPPNSTSYYESGTKDSSKRSNHKWSSKERSRLSTLNRSKVGKEDFVQLDDFEMRVGADFRKGVSNGEVTTESFSDRSLTRSFKSNEDVLPLATTPARAPMDQPVNGIMVQMEYSVDRVISDIGLAENSMSEGGIRDKRPFRV